MLEKLTTELKIRGFSEQTIKAYSLHNEKFLGFIKKEPASVETEDIKKYMAHLISDRGYKPSSTSLAMSSLKFLYDDMMGKSLFSDIKMPKLEKKLPTVLTKDEMKQLIDSISNIKHKLLVKMLSLLFHKNWLDLNFLFFLDLLLHQGLLSQGMLP